MYNQNSGYGAALLNRLNAVAASVCPTFGRIFVVMSPSDSADPNFQILQEVCKNDPDGNVRFFTTIAAAYAATTTNNNDVILLDSHTAHLLTEMLEVKKSRVHFVGMAGAGRKLGARSRIEVTGAGVANDVSLIKVTGTGTTWHNLKIVNAFTVAENLYGFTDQGSNTYMEYCDIENLGSAHLTNANAASFNCSGGEGIYKECNFGVYTLQHTAVSGQEVLLGATSRCGGNIFDHCFFRSWTTQITHVFVRAGAAAINSSIVNFEDCIFNNRGTVASGGVTLTAAVATNSGLGGRICFSYPRIDGCADLATSAGGCTGCFVVSPVTSTAASDCISIQCS